MSLLRCLCFTFQRYKLFEVKNVRLHMVGSRIVLGKASASVGISPTGVTTQNLTPGSVVDWKESQQLE